MEAAAEALSAAQPARNAGRSQQLKVHEYFAPNTSSLLNTVISNGWMQPTVYSAVCHEYKEYKESSSREDEM